MRSWLSGKVLSKLGFLWDADARNGRSRPAALAHTPALQALGQYRSGLPLGPRRGCDPAGRCGSRETKESLQRRAAIRRGQRRVRKHTML